MFKKKTWLVLGQIAGTIILYLLLFTFFIGTVNISGASMYPTLHDEDFVLITKLNLNQENINRFDVVYFHSDSLGVEVVKRVIGLPGEFVEYIDDKLYIDGKYIEETFFDQSHVEQSKIDFNTAKFTENFSYQVPEGELFVMGDNRLRSTDSRVFGSITFDSLLGKRGIILYPFSNLEWVE